MLYNNIEFMQLLTTICIFKNNFASQIIIKHTTLYYTILIIDFIYLFILVQQISNYMMVSVEAVLVTWSLKLCIYYSKI